MLADRIRMSSFKKNTKPNQFILVTNNQLSKPMGQYSLKNLTYIKKSSFKITSKVVCDEKYGYGTYSSELIKFDKDTLMSIKEIKLPNRPGGIALDDNYIYIHFSNRIIKCDKFNLTEISRVTNVPYSGQLLVDNQYLYSMERGWNKSVSLYKIDKVTMQVSSFITSNAYANWDFAQDEEFLYIAGSSDSLTPSLKKFRKSDLSLVATAMRGYGGRKHQRHSSIAVDSNYVYVGGGDFNGRNKFAIYKFNKTDLKFVLASPQEYASYNSLAVDEDFLYIGGYSRVVIRLLKNDLTYSGESPPYEARIDNLTIC